MSIKKRDGKGDRCQKGDRKFIDFSNTIKVRKALESDLQLFMAIKTNITETEK